MNLSTLAIILNDNLGTLTANFEEGGTAYTYIAPKTLLSQVQPGHRVLVESSGKYGVSIATVQSVEMDTLAIDPADGKDYKFAFQAVADPAIVELRLGLSSAVSELRKQRQIEARAAFMATYTEKLQGSGTELPVWAQGKTE